MSLGPFGTFGLNLDRTGSVYKRAQSFLNLMLRYQLLSGSSSCGIHDGMRSKQVTRGDGSTFLITRCPRAEHYCRPAYRRRTMRKYLASS